MGIQCEALTRLVVFERERWVGCYGMSGAYGPADAESIATIRRALDLGGTQPCLTARCAADSRWRLAPPCTNGSSMPRTAASLPAAFLTMPSRPRMRSARISCQAAASSPRHRAGRRSRRHPGTERVWISGIALRPDRHPLRRSRGSRGEPARPQSWGRPGSGRHCSRRSPVRLGMSGL